MSYNTSAIGWVLVPSCRVTRCIFPFPLPKGSLRRQNVIKSDLPMHKTLLEASFVGLKLDAIIAWKSSQNFLGSSGPLIFLLDASHSSRSNLVARVDFGKKTMFSIQRIVRGRSKTFLSAPALSKTLVRGVWPKQRIGTNISRFCQQFKTFCNQSSFQQEDLATSEAGGIYKGGKVYEHDKPHTFFSVTENYPAERIYVQSNPLPPLVSEDLKIQNPSRISSLPDCSPSDVPDIEKPVKALPVENALEREAWDLLRQSVVSYCGSPIGTVAANDITDPCTLNYDQVFLRDFIPSAIAFLLKGEAEIVRNFILHTLQLQSWEKTVDCYSPGQGLMPASFKVRVVPLEGGDSKATEEILDPDFGESAIGRVAPVDSGLWWIILLRAYGKCTGDFALQERLDVQTGMKLILKLCLSDGFDMFPTLLVTDGSCMIDRRMGIHGHPLEIQALFYSALRCAREMLRPEDGAHDIIRAINSRLSALSFHVREYYWVDLRKLNIIYRYKTEEYSFDAVNKFNIYPDQVSPWLMEWMPEQGGYFIGNLQPAHMDFRFFSLGNLWSIVGSLATQEQAAAILDLIEARWNDFVGKMPLKICFPALEYEEWRIITGSDPKNTPWSYHNGGSWPTLVWQFTVACIKMKRLDLAARCLEVVEKRISKDRWPEYYDTRSARFIGKQARLYQTWSIAGYLVAKSLLANPEAASILTFDEDMDLLAACSCCIDANPSKKRCRKTSA